MDKETTARAVVAALRDGMTIGIGGWGPRRKPMALVREILRSDLRDLTVVAYGGPDVGMLCAAGKVARLVFGFVSLDAIPLEPYFRKARQSGALQVTELDEGLLLLGLRAAAQRLPFLPTRLGLGSDVTRVNPGLRTVRSPYDDGEVLLAMPAIPLDAALVHVDRADRRGNTRTFGADPYFDEAFLRAARQGFVTCETLVDRIEDDPDDDPSADLVERALVTGVVAAPGGAHPTSCPPAYGWDAAHLKRYADGAATDDGWQGYASEFLAGGESDYLARVGGAAAVARLPVAVL